MKTEQILLTLTALPRVGKNSFKALFIFSDKSMDGIDLYDQIKIFKERGNKFQMYQVNDIVSLIEH